MAYAAQIHTGDGSTIDWNVPFTYLDQSHIGVSVDKVRTTAVGADYKFEWINSTTVRVRTVIADNPVPTGLEIKVFRETPIATPAVVFGGGASLTSSNLNKNSDYLTYALQEATDDNDAFTRLYLGAHDTLPTTDNEGDPLQVGAIAFLTTDNTPYYWNGAAWKKGDLLGEALASQLAAQAAQVAAEAAQTAAETAQTGAETAETNAGTSETNAASSATAAAGSASAAATSASNAATSETNANTHKVAAQAAQTGAETAETNAATSETNAASSASAAATSATNAATSETNASGSASAAATSATNASTSASNAATSESNAAASEAKAEDWAEELEDVQVEVGKYSALHHAAKASASATAAASSASAASTSETNAATSETNANSHKNAASTSETNAATSETNAANSASAAATSASNASTSESNASASETAAQAAQAAAELAYDNFDDRYLGAKASDPTLDNDGNALLVGALYFNTTTKDMKVWEGAAWDVAYASSAGALIDSNNLSDVTNAATARTNLGVAIGTDVQAYSANLDSVNQNLGTGDTPEFAGMGLGTPTPSTLLHLESGAPVIRLEDSDTGSYSEVSANSGIGNFYLNYDKGGFNANSVLQIQQAGVELAQFAPSGMRLGGSGSIVDIIRDEDDMASNDVNALATQQSIKAYVDNQTTSFDSLTGKTSGTGDFSTNADLVSGRGSGGVALTINDGYGNANVTFNHQDGVPEQNGNSARIEVNTDSTTGAKLVFSLESNVTQGVATGLADKFTIDETGVTVVGDIDGDTVSGAMIASQAEAEAGTNNNHIMTPLRVQNAIDANVVSVDQQIFSASGTWNKPSSGTQAIIEVWGAGGSGGRNSGGDAGGGGGGGAYKRVVLPLSSLGSTETVTVGAGGASRTSNESDGLAGGNSSFGSHATAYGGGGGAGSTGARGGGGGGGGSEGAGQTVSDDLGGTGGAGRGADSGLYGKGGDGGHATTSTDTDHGENAYTGGGGGGPGNTSASYLRHAGGSLFGGGGGGGCNCGSISQGQGGVSGFGGNGGDGARDGTAATAGEVPGGGGGGSETGNSGAGADGLVIVRVI